MNILVLSLALLLWLVGMCLVVRALFFMFNIIVTTHSDVSDTDHIVRDSDDVNNVEANVNDEEVYVIDNSTSNDNFSKDCQLFILQEQ